jgi:hypothetical protein
MRDKHAASSKRQNDQSEADHGGPRSAGAVGLLHIPESLLVAPDQLTE